jgi:GDPmannose 4,6-dehydratase
VSKKNALILGGSGQDGAFLAQEYLNLGFTVFSVSRSTSSRMEVLGVKQFVKDFLVDMDIKAILKETEPEIVANLASASSVAFCESNPEFSKKINLDAVLQLSHSVENYASDEERIIKFIQASSSEMFGESDQICTETTLMNPVTIYGKHKHDAHKFILSRNAKNVEYKSVILFNHESEYRTKNFVSSKVARSAAEVKTFGETKIEFGNLESKRDWGFAGDYMEALALISDQGESDCYVVASGQTYSIEEMLRTAFAHIEKPEFNKYVSINSDLFRTKETPPKLGISEKCRSELNWQPSLSFEQLVARLVNYQIRDIQRGLNG